MAATVGKGSAASVLQTSWPSSENSRAANASSSWLTPLMSAPATNARPAPVTTSPLTSTFASAAANASESSTSTSSFSAFNASWRSTVTTATGPSSS
jgi:hypothetical protein